MLFTLTKITKQSITFKNNEKTLTFDIKLLDKFARIKVGNQYEIENNEFPYRISARRRREIAAYHMEEGRCGCI